MKHLSGLDKGSNNQDNTWRGRPDTEGELKCKTGKGITDSTLKKTMCLESTVKYKLYEQTKCSQKLTTHFGITKTSVTRQRRNYSVLSLSTMSQINATLSVVTNKNPVN